MTVIDINPDVDWTLGFKPEEAAYVSILTIWDLADVMEIGDLTILARVLTELTNDLVGMANSSRTLDIAAKASRKAAAHAKGISFPECTEALANIMRILSLVRHMSRADLEHLTYRLARLANDVVYAASDAGKSQRKRLNANLALGRFRHA